MCHVVNYQDTSALQMPGLHGGTAYGNWRYPTLKMAVPPGGIGGTTYVNWWYCTLNMAIPLRLLEVLGGNTNM